ncbi:MAG TPA: lipopolysaccharide kinase InaA family protein [Gemmatimonadaceae bacterium]
MIGESRESPPGFVAFTVGTARAVCLDAVAGDVRDALRGGTLYDFAASRSDARAIAGRGTAYVASFPGGERVVVRHNRHGGALALLTRDLFRAPTRAPLELDISEELRRLGVPTPVMLAYAIYPAVPGLWRADVVTRYVAPSADLAAVLLANDDELRTAAWEATALLLREMSAAGVRHHDLNAKNVLLHLRSDDQPLAMVLDVDRVVFGVPPERALEGNTSRLFRSLRKWRSLYGARVDESEIDALARRVRAATAAPSMTRS